MTSPSGSPHDALRPRWRRRPRALVVVAAAAVAIGVGGVGITAAMASTSGAITGYGGKCVDIAAASSANGAAVQLYTCNGTNAQSWTVGNTDNSIQALGKCLDAKDVSSANGTPLQLWDCAASTNQRWTFA